MDQFRDEVWQIMNGRPPLREVLSLTNPASYGWQRRSEFDEEGLDAWEQPDGTLCGNARVSSGAGRSLDRASRPGAASLAIPQPGEPDTA